MGRKDKKGDSAEQTADDGGDYKCEVETDSGKLQAKFNLNTATATHEKSGVAPPKLKEKPTIKTIEGGKQVEMIVQYEDDSQGQCQWYFKESKVVKSSTNEVTHKEFTRKFHKNYYECRLVTPNPGYSKHGVKEPGSKGNMKENGPKGDGEGGTYVGGNADEWHIHYYGTEDGHVKLGDNRFDFHHNNSPTKNYKIVQDAQQEFLKEIKNGKKLPNEKSLKKEIEKLVSHFKKLSGI